MADQVLNPRKPTLMRNRDILGRTNNGQQQRRAGPESTRSHQRRRPTTKILFQRLLIQIRSHKKWSDRDNILRANFILGTVFLLLYAASGIHSGGRGLFGETAKENNHGRNMMNPILDMRDIGYVSKPLSVMAFFDKEGIVIGVSQLSSRPDHYPSHRQVKELTDLEIDPKESKRYKRRLREPVNVGDCVAKAEWQKRTYPSCSIVHEVNFSPSSLGDSKVRLLNNGYFSDIFRMREFDGEHFVLKRMRYVHDFTDRNFHRYEKEATSMEKLTASPHIVDIFGFCGGTSLIEYSDGGDLSADAIDNRDRLSQLSKLRIAHQVALAISDLHSLPIAHTDITLWQFLKIKGQYKLNDFNRVRWIRRDKETNEDCGFKVAVNGGKWRAPEEYAYKEETEKIDVYSMGNIFYVLLTGLDVFEDVKSDDVYEQVQQGERPKVPSLVTENADSVDSTLMVAMAMCHVQDPKKRSSAEKVADFLHAELTNYEHMQGIRTQ